MPNFKSDLAQEQILAKYLNGIYDKLGYDYERIESLPRQLNGEDLWIHHAGKRYIIDEKSQLHYLNKDLPTFTFELSYLKKKKIKQGWLYDKAKTTDFYFLVTAISLDDESTTLTEKSRISSLKITSVNRSKLLNMLTERGLSEDVLSHYEDQIRETNHFGRNEIDRLNSKSEGLLYYTEHLTEKPMNLQLRLSFLIKMGVAKSIYPMD